MKTIYTSLTIFKLFVGKFIVDLGKTRRNGKRGFGKVCTYFKKLIVLNLCEHQPWRVQGESWYLLLLFDLHILKFGRVPKAPDNNWLEHWVGSTTLYPSFSLLSAVNCTYAIGALKTVWVDCDKLDIVTMNCYLGPVVRKWFKITQAKCEIWTQIWEIYESLKSKFSLILFAYNLMIGYSKKI